MDRRLTAADLIAFEDEVAALFNAGRIRAPIHLSGGNEAWMLSVFDDVKPEDWVFCGWRSHFPCLLKGVPRAQLLAEILAGRSIALCFPEHRIVSSAIVGGVLPMAVGAALAVKRAGGKERVHCFLGDMTAVTGMFHECKLYAANFDLPIRWVIEVDGRSVCTDTASTWGYRPQEFFAGDYKGKRLVHYRYKNRWPHAGSGKRIEF